MSEQYRSEFGRVEKEGVWTFWRVMKWFILATVILGVLGFTFTMLSRPGQVIEQVTRPEKIIANYEWFRETFNDAQALDRQIVTAQTTLDGFSSALPETRSDWQRVDSIEYNRLQAVGLGLRNQRESVVADYNARSSMITRKLFKGSGVPAELGIVNDTTIFIWEN